MKEKLRHLFQNGIFRKVCYILFILLLCHFVIDFIEEYRTHSKLLGLILYPFIGLFLLFLLFFSYIFFILKIVKKVKLVTEYFNLTLIFVISYFVFSDLYNYVRTINVVQDSYIQRNLFSEEKEDHDTEAKLFLFSQELFSFTLHDEDSYSWFKKRCSPIILFNISSDEFNKLDSVDQRFFSDRWRKFYQFSDTLIPIDKAIDELYSRYGEYAFFSDCEKYLNFFNYNAVNTKDTLLYSLEEYYSEIGNRLRELRALGIFNEVKIMTEFSKSDYQDGYNFKIGFFGYGLNKHKLFFLGLNFLFFICKVILLHHILKDFDVFPNLKKYGLMSFFKKIEITRD